MVIWQTSIPSLSFFTHTYYFFLLNTNSCTEPMFAHLLCLKIKTAGVAYLWFLAHKLMNKLVYTKLGNVEELLQQNRTQYVKNFVIPATFGTKFSDLFPEGTNLSRKKFPCSLGHLAIMCLRAISGGDVGQLLLFLCERESVFSDLRSTGTRSGDTQHKLDNVTSSLTSAISFLSESNTPSPSVDEEKEEKEWKKEEAQKSSVLKGISYVQLEKQQLLRVILANSGLSFKFLCEQGFTGHGSNFSRLKNSLKQKGFRALVLKNTQTRGRKPATQTHAHVLKKFEILMQEPQNSMASNTRKLKKQSLPVREFSRPFYQASASSGLQKSVTFGGGKSAQNMLSASTLYKYRPTYIVPAIANTMGCSDCAQRNVDINFLNRVFSAEIKEDKFFEHQSVGVLESLVCTRDALVVRCENYKFTKNEIAEIARRFLLLRGTQVHYSVFRFQTKLRQTQREQPMVGHCVIVGDFAQNFVVGHKKDETEATRRTLSLVTVFAVALEFWEEGSSKLTIVHNIVFSSDLIHSAFSACRYIDIVLRSSRVQSIINSMHTVHFWNDNGKHLNCAEHSTYLHVEVMNLFPNVLVLTENRHGAKHGKDLADASVSLVKRAVRVLELQGPGYTSPKLQMDQLRHVITDSHRAMQSLTGKSSELHIFWSDSVVPPRLMRVLTFPAIDSSVCRKSFRNEKGGKVFLAEHFRFDVPVGIEIPFEFQMKNRPRHIARKTQPIGSLEDAVCSEKVQRQRYLKRTSNVREIAGLSNINLDNVINSQIPFEIDLESKPAKRVISLKVAKDLPRFSFQGPFLVPSRKRKKVGSSQVVPFEVRNTHPGFKWDTKKAILMSKNIATSLFTCGDFPTREQFLRMGHKALYDKIIEGAFGVGPKRFAGKCDLRFFK